MTYVILDIETERIIYGGDSLTTAARAWTRGRCHGSGYSFRTANSRARELAKN